MSCVEAAPAPSLLEFVADLPVPSGAGCATFAKEADLVAAAVLALESGRNAWGVVEFGLEFDYRRGRTDIVAVSQEGKVIAIEAKLRAWREAMQQAYRNTCFAAESYVLLPLAAAYRATAHILDFQRRGVGICTLLDGSFLILHPARHQSETLEPWLTQRAAEFASSVE